MDFSKALWAIKLGKKACRFNWKNKHMFIYLCKESEFKVNKSPLLGIYPEGTEIKYHAHIDMKTAEGYCVPWIASQEDLLCEDWEIKE